MKMSVISPSEIDVDTWRSLQSKNDALASPYFSPEFTQAVAAVRDDVKVAVLEENSEVVGYFPFQRDASGACAAVAGALSDHHGVIASPDTKWDWPELLRVMDVDHWRFDHLVGSQAQGPTCRPCESPILDLSSGYAEYKAKRKRDSRRFAELDRKARKLEREVGPIHFEVNATPDVLRQVIEWKSAQCRSTGVHDYFTLQWTRDLVHRIYETRTPQFSGVLSALYAGEKLLAAHMGMRSTRCFHWWFPTYDHEFARYSPGLLLLQRVAESAAQYGASYVDLGKGDDRYKESFADASLPIAEGMFTRPSLLNVARAAQLKAERWLRESPMMEPLRPALRVLRRLRDQRVYS